MIIKASLRTLRREDVRPAQLQEAARDIDEEISRLNRIVTEVLDFARPIKFDLAPADLNALASDAAKAAAAHGGRHPIRLGLDPDVPPITTDAERLRQVLVNVLSNAAPGDGRARRGRGGRADPPRNASPRRHARRRHRPRSWRGDCAPSIWRRSSIRTSRPGAPGRESASRSPATSSRAWAGRISVSSQPERGTEVRIELPAGTPEHHDCYRFHSAGRRRRQDPERARRRRFARKGTRWSPPQSPRDAQRILARRFFDVLVVDNLMPELTGLDLIRELAAAPRRRAAADRDDDGARDDRERDRGDEARRLRLPAEAVRDRRTDRGREPRAGSPAAADAARLSHSRARRGIQPLRHRRPQPAHAGGHPHGRDGGENEEHRPHHRRDRHGQGDGGARHPLPQRRSARCRSSR